MMYQADSAEPFKNGWSLSHAQTYINMREVTSGGAVKVSFMNWVFYAHVHVFFEWLSGLMLFVLALRHLEPNQYEFNVYKIASRIRKQCRKL